MTPDDFEKMSTEEIWNILPQLEGLPKADAYYELSNRLFEERKYEMSASTAEQSAAVAKEVPDLVLAGKATWRQGICSYKQREFAEAVELFKLAASLCGEAGDSYGLANSLNWVADAALAIEDYDTAIPHAINALEIGEAEEFPYIAGWAAHFAAKATFFKTKERSALDFSIRARNNFRKVSDLPKVSMADDFAATVHDHFEEFDQALNLLRSCLNIAEATADKHDDPYANRRIGNAYYKVRLYDDALHHLTKARASYQIHEDLRFVAYCDRDIADSLYMLDREREALTTLERAQSLFDSMGDDSWVRSCLIKRSQVHEFLGEYHLSERLWKQAITSMESDPNFDNGNRYFWAKLSLANQYVDTERFMDALSLIDSLNETGFVPADWNLIRKHTLRARALNAMNRIGESLAEVEAALSLTTDENLDAGTAYLYEIRGTQLLESGKKAGERDIAHAIAIHLASGEDNRARELAKVFIPKLNHEKDLGLGETTLLDSDEERDEQSHPEELNE